MPIVVIQELSEVIQKRQHQERRWEAAMHDKKLQETPRVTLTKSDRASQAMDEALKKIIGRGKGKSIK